VYFRLPSTLFTSAFNIGLALLFPLFPPCTLKILFDLEGGDEAHGVMLSAFRVGLEL